MQQAMQSTPASADSRRTLAARLIDAPGFTWATLGALVSAAADESAAEGVERQAQELVAAAAAYIRSCHEAGASA